MKKTAERVGKTKHWSLDKDLAPLKAPNQRAIQRFMNIFPWMDWADSMQACCSGQRFSDISDMLTRGEVYHHDNNRRT